MEFIKMSNGLYLIKGSNNIIVDEKEKLEIERDNSIMEDFKSDGCQKENIKKRKVIEKKIEEVDGTNTIEETK